MGPAQPSETYRLIVVFDDGVRVVGLSGLSKTMAEQFQARMLELTGFTTVLVEAEPVNSASELSPAARQ